ncbi:hypothetical protein LWF01_13880 [Saxibacter everestensis]|uniref:Uncharacterized protein n=1 Tax=Saxibacter everestensis TaxID=2909229 RepID=A0ABY8QQC1_9MICO|nr:hypothetical protein LWF01_13880 [Brevibacteriaceae bacterium ZFBP1038]
MIDWFAFLIVLVVTVVSSATVVSIFAVGVRLLAISSDSAEVDAANGVSMSPRNKSLRAAGFACFAVCGFAVLLGVYFIIPALH